jgi:hypothetical protein
LASAPRLFLQHHFCDEKEAITLFRKSTFDHRLAANLVCLHFKLGRRLSLPELLQKRRFQKGRGKRIWRD